MFRLLKVPFERMSLKTFCNETTLLLSLNAGKQVKIQLKKYAAETSAKTWKSVNVKQFVIEPRRKEADQQLNSQRDLGLTSHLHQIWTQTIQLMMMMTTTLMKGVMVYVLSHYVWYCFICFNPFTPKNDEYLNSPYNFNTWSSRQVMRIKKIIN